MDRREFIKSLAALIGTSVVARLPTDDDVETITFIEFDIDEKLLDAAVYLDDMRLNKETGKIDLEIRFETDKVLQAITIVADDGSRWNTSDGGFTWSDGPRSFSMEELEG